MKSLKSVSGAPFNKILFLIEPIFVHLNLDNFLDKSFFHTHVVFLLSLLISLYCFCHIKEKKVVSKLSNIGCTYITTLFLNTLKVIKITFLTFISFILASFIMFNDVFLFILLFSSVMVAKLL
jgi:hypothetical protein